MLQLNCIETTYMEMKVHMLSVNLNSNLVIGGKFNPRVFQYSDHSTGYRLAVSALCHFKITGITACSFLLCILYSAQGVEGCYICGILYHQALLLCQLTYPVPSSFKIVFPILSYNLALRTDMHLHNPHTYIIPLPIITFRNQGSHFSTMQVKACSN